ncbi:MAG: aldehyde dehydrogenase (NADP(+)) [Acidobacteriaceae bacterium]
MELKGLSLIAGKQAKASGGTEFRAINPQSGDSLEPRFTSATVQDVNNAVEAAHQAFAIYGRTSGRERARFLRSIADGIDAASAELAARGQLETALPAQPRLQGEIKRAANQFRLFADLVEEGSWVAACIDTALPDRQPLPRPDLRSMLRPIGPVAVFGASNFPIAFSVAGGDTASALAAGNPVVVKAHPAHPGTSEIAARVIAASVEACGLPAGVFSLVFDSGIEIGKALVQHPLICAVGFTGSLGAGRALMDLAAQRPRPIPCFAEMSSTNPVFVLPSALRERGSQIANGLYNSFTASAGQMCTKPGMVFLPEQHEAETFVTELRALVSGSNVFTLLTPGIAASYDKALQNRTSRKDLKVGTATAKKSDGCGASAALLETRIDDFLNNPELSHELFGPSSLIIRYQERESIMRAAESLDGHLTATVIGSAEDLIEYRDLVEVLEKKAGRVIFNGFPTGVEVSHSMVHGGPYPSTSDSRFTSVGSQAILRFARPVCYQGFPDAALPDELRNANSLKILRKLNGHMTTDPVE